METSLNEKVGCVEDVLLAAVHDKFTQNYDGYFAAKTLIADCSSDQKTLHIPNMSSDSSNLHEATWKEPKLWGER